VATRHGYGTWARFGIGRLLLSVDVGGAEALAGAATHSHAFAQPSPHAAHVVTQPAAHPNHVVTQPGAHPNHVVTQPADHAAIIAHTHGLNVQGGTTAAVTGTHVMTSTATGGSARAITAGDAGLSAGSGATMAHSATAVDAHGAHSGAAVDAHSAHSGAAVDAHSAHAGGAVTDGTNAPPSIGVYVWKRTA
jgi:hypothetical protein